MKKMCSWLLTVALLLALSACQDPAEETPLPAQETAADTEGPAILGVKDWTVEAGSAVSYRTGVSAVDRVEGKVPFQVDATAVDLAVPGDYPVVYTAADSSGNVTTRTVTLTVEPGEETDPEGETEPAAPVVPEVPIPDDLTAEDVYALCDKVLARITNEGMSQYDKALAIYNYVHNNIRYVGTSDKSSWVRGAWVGFVRGRGDCFNYFACSKALLTRAGIPNVDLQRVGGNTRHYWQLVNVGSGWYHFDACWHPAGHQFNSFLLTEAQAREKTEELSAVRPNYYVYDYAACPVRPVGIPEDDTLFPPLGGEMPQEGETAPGEGEEPGWSQGEGPDEEEPILPPEAVETGTAALPAESQPPTEGETPIETETPAETETPPEPEASAQPREPVLPPVEGGETPVIAPEAEETAADSPAP